METLLETVKERREILFLLKQCKEEITNLRIKINNKEALGWEGEKRRTILLNNIDKILK